MPWAFLHFIQKSDQVSRNPQFCRVLCERVEKEHKFARFERKYISHFVYKAQRIQRCLRSWTLFIGRVLASKLSHYRIGKTRNIFSWRSIRSCSICFSTSGDFTTRLTNQIHSVIFTRFIHSCVCSVVFIQMSLVSSLLRTLSPAVRSMRDPPLRNADLFEQLYG